MGLRDMERNASKRAIFNVVSGTPAEIEYPSKAFPTSRPKRYAYAKRARRTFSNWATETRSQH